MVGGGVARDWTAVGVIKIILMPLSSGMGERILLLATRDPTRMATRRKKPTMMAIAASVFFRSSILEVYCPRHKPASHRPSTRRAYLISSFFQAANVQVG